MSIVTRKYGLVLLAVLLVSSGAAAQQQAIPFSEFMLQQQQVNQDGYLYFLPLSVEVVGPETSKRSYGLGSDTVNNNDTYSALRNELRLQLVDQMYFSPDAPYSTSSKDDESGLLLRVVFNEVGYRVNSMSNESDWMDVSGSLAIEHDGSTLAVMNFSDRLPGQKPVAMLAKYLVWMFAHESGQPFSKEFIPIKDALAMQFGRYQQLADTPKIGSGTLWRKSDGGFQVGQILSGSPLHLSGFVPGDIVVSVNGLPSLGNMTADQFIAAAAGLGTPAPARVRRGADTIQLPLFLSYDRRLPRELGYSEGWPDPETPINAQVNMHFANNSWCKERPLTMKTGVVQWRILEGVENCAGLKSGKVRMMSVGESIFFEGEVRNGYLYQGTFFEGTPTEPNKTRYTSRFYRGQPVGRTIAVSREGNLYKYYYLADGTKGTLVVYQGGADGLPDMLVYSPQGDINVPLSVDQGRQLYALLQRYVSYQDPAENVTNYTENLYAAYRIAQSQKRERERIAREREEAERRTARAREDNASGSGRGFAMMALGAIIGTSDLSSSDKVGMLSSAVSDIYGNTKGAAMQDYGNSRAQEIAGQNNATLQTSTDLPGGSSSSSMQHTVIKFTCPGTGTEFNQSVSYPNGESCRAALEDYTKAMVCNSTDAMAKGKSCKSACGAAFSICAGY